jgi:peptide/nickel transport system permease protein
MQLRYYLLRRVLLLIPTVIGVTILVFVLSRVIPGDPAALAAGDFASPEMVQALRDEFGLDRPLYEQYILYMGGLLEGDLGTSMFTRESVTDELLRVMPATLELMLVSLVLAIAVAIPAGVLSAVLRDRAVDHVTRVVAISSISLPRFWLAMMLQLVFALGLSLLPIAGRFASAQPPPATITGFYLIDSLLAGDLESFGIALRHLTLPAIALSLGPMATILRMTRSSMLEVLNREYVTMARAAGLAERVVVMKYALKNALIATVTVIGIAINFMIAGALLVETVFAWPGLGSYMFRAVLQSDFQPIAGATIVVGVIIALVNLAVDLTYGLLDPRIRYG